MTRPGDKHSARAAAYLERAGYKKEAATGGSVVDAQARVTTSSPTAREAHPYYGGNAQEYDGPDGYGVPKMEGGRQSRFEPGEGVMASRSRGTYRDSDTMIEAGSEDGAGRFGGRKK